ncbi:B-cell receptor CD22-like isoform X2 [Conger conger]|nr:B-cell receptor CD22-like isoform X2 [Conger conger]
MHCNYSYPTSYSVQKTVWFIHQIPNQEPDDLSLDPEYSDRVEYLGDRNNDCTFKIKQLRESDSKTYHFRFLTYNADGKYTGQPGVTLDVTALQVIMYPGTVTEGQSVTLNCSTTCNLTGRPAFTWYRDGSPLSFTTQTHQLTASSEDGGRYSCVVKGYEDLPSPAVALSVNYSPKDTSVSVSPSGEILEGSSVTLTCSSDANPPVQNYTWFKKNRAVSLWRESGFNHTIANILSLDSGQYYCEAQNQLGAQKSTAVTIDVQYAPKNTSVSVSPSGEIMEGISVTLTCSSNASPPVQNYTWFKENRAVFSWRKSGLNHTITNILSQDSGQYYCEVQNQVGAQNSTTETIDVQYYPKNTSASVSPSGEIVEGSSVTLTCSSDANPPVQNYTWFKNNETGVWQAGSGQSLNFSNFRSWNSGHYYCVSQNKHGAQNSTGLSVDYAAMGNEDLPYYIIAGTFTAACAAVLIVVAWIVGRRSRSRKEQRSDTEDTVCTVYANVSESAISATAVQETIPEKEEAEYSNVEKPQNQEEVLYSTVQKRPAQCVDEVQYASIQFPQSAAASGSTVPTSEDVIYTTLVK